MGCEYMIPPAPNWFSTSALRACRSSKHVAYPSQNQIVIVESPDVPESADCENWRGNADGSQQLSPPKTYIISDAHEDKSKICSVAWSPAEEYTTGCPNLVSAADDGIVRLWSWSVKGHSLKSQHVIHSDNRAKVFGLDWSSVDTNLVVSGDESGNFVTWDTASNRLKKYYFGKYSVMSLALHREDSDLMASGSKNGLVLIVTFAGSGRVIHKMRGHDEDCYSVSWCPIKNDDWKLVSSSRDKTLRIWSQNEGKQVKKFRVPGRNRNQAPSFLTCLWYDEHRILSGGENGELLLFHLDIPDKKDGIKCDVLHREHFKSLFSVCVVEGIVYSNGQDRIICTYNLNTNRLLYNLPTLNGFAYCLATNQLDPSIMAVGAGDGIVRVWKTASNQLFDIRHVVVKQAKVMSLAWHPQREGLLGFGTDEGRVGWVDVLSQKMFVTYSDYQHRGGVYCTCWAPGRRCSETEDNGQDNAKEDFLLYTVGDGKFVQHNTKSNKHEEITSRPNFNTSEKKPNISQAVFKQIGDQSYFLLGCEDGSIEFRCLADMKLVLTLKGFTKLIQFLAFHPDILNDGSDARYKNWLAACSNETTIHAWDLNNVFTNSQDEARILVTPTVKLEGHFLRVIELSWNCFLDGRLLSISYDSSAQVWDLETATPLHNFQGHNKRLMCCMWHPGDADLAISGGEDYYLAIWRPSFQTQTRPVERKRIKRGKQQVVREVETVVAEASASEMSFDDLLKKHKEDQFKKKINGDRESPSPSPSNNPKIDQARERETLTAKRDRKVVSKTFLPVFSKKEFENVESCGEDCVKIVEYLKKSEGAEDLDELSEQMKKMSFNGDEGKAADADIDEHLSLFCASDKFDSLLDKECQAVTDNAKSTLTLWRGNFLDVLQSAESQGCLTDSLVAKSAGISQVLWRRYAAAYAQQLAKEGDYIRASEYYVATHMVHEAIEVLHKNNLCLQAIVLAKSRLPQNDPMFKQLYSSLALQSWHSGNLRLAAKSWAAAANPAKAASALAKIDTKSSLRAAVKLAVDPSEVKMYAQLCFTRCVIDSDFETGLDLTASLASGDMNWGSLLLIIMREMQSLLSKDKAEPSEPLFKLISNKVKELNVELKDDMVDPIEQFLKSTVISSPLKMRCMKASCLLAMALLHANKNPQLCLDKVALCLADFHKYPEELEKVCGALLPQGSQPKEAGQALLDKPLDWQCSWQQLRSIQCSEAVAILHSKTSNWTEDLMQDVADAIMLEDVLLVQKLEQEISEGEKALATFKVEPKDENEGCNGVSNDVQTNGCVDEEVGEVKKSSDGASGQQLDLTPSLLGTQTVSIGSDGNWATNDGAAAGQMPPAAAGIENLPPPPKQTPSFHTRFLEGKTDTVEAEKELQKLRWVLSKHPVDVPYPDLTSCCQTLLGVVLQHQLGNITAEEEEEGKKINFSKKLARFGYYKGVRTYQSFFLQHS